MGQYMSFNALEAKDANASAALLVAQQQKLFMPHGASLWVDCEHQKFGGDKRSVLIHRNAGNLGHRPLEADGKPVQINIDYFFSRNMVVYGSNRIQFCSSSKMSVIVGVDVEDAKMYCGMIFDAGESAKHVHGRIVRESQLDMLLEGDQNTEEIVASSKAKAKKEEDGRVPLTVEACGEPPALDDQETLEENSWRYALMYTVREGTLIFFSDDLDECADRLGAIVKHGKADAEEGGNSPRWGVLGPLGNIGPMDQFCEFLMTDLGRSFTINKETLIPSGLDINDPLLFRKKTFHYPGALELGKKKGLCKSDTEIAPPVEAFAITETNCVLWTMRALKTMMLVLHGERIALHCRSAPSLGDIAGDAVKVIWNRLWNNLRHC